MIFFPAWIPDYDTRIPALLDFFSFLTLLSHSDYFVVSLSITFSLNSKGNAPFHHTAYNNCCAETL